ncbi:MAG: fructose PTS transporter subunit IIB, partial [Bacilli bacterium]
MKIVAITSCPTGVAHTYMAASRLEAEAKKQGHLIKVEKQGAKGIEDRLTQEEINDADLIIFAVETKVKDEERFDHVKVYRCSVTNPIKDPALVIEQAKAFKDGSQVKQKIGIKNHILTGVSYMIPIVIAASLIMGIARIGGMAFNVTDIWDDAHAGSGLLGFFHTLDGLGGMSLGLMLPVLAGFISYSIADRQGLAAGFAGGMLAKNINAGFFGALAAGLIAGYL